MMERIRLLLYKIGAFHFASDIEDVATVIEMKEVIKIDEGTGIFHSILPLEEEQLIFIYLPEYYSQTERAEDIKILILDMEHVYSRIQDRKIIDRINRMHNFYKQNGFSVNKRYFSIAIANLANIADVETGSIQRLPFLYRSSPRYRELWGTCSFDAMLYVLLDLKKFIITQISEVF